MVTGSGFLPGDLVSAGRETYGYHALRSWFARIPESIRIMRSINSVPRRKLVNRVSVDDLTGGGVALPACIREEEERRSREIDMKFGHKDC